MDSGKDVSILANDAVYVDQNTANVQSPSSDNATNLSDLQKAILAGKDLTQLEETVAGNGDAGSGDGVSLGEAKFAEGGHESNIYAYNKNIDDNNYAFATPAQSVGTAANDDNGNSEDTIVLDTSVSLTLELKTADGNDNIITEKELHDGKDGEKIVGTLIVGKDIVVNMANDKIVISVDGRKIGDAKITKDLGNGKYEYELTNVRTEEFTDGTSNKTGKIEATYDAHDKQGNTEKVSSFGKYLTEFSGPKQEDDPSKVDDNENGVFIDVKVVTANGGDNVFSEKELNDGKDAEKVTGKLVVGKDIVVGVNDIVTLKVGEDSKPINVTSTTNVAFEFDVKDGTDSHLTSGGEKVIWKSVPAVGGGCKYCYSCRY